MGQGLAVQVALIKDIGINPRDIPHAHARELFDHVPAEAAKAKNQRLGLKELDLAGNLGHPDVPLEPTRHAPSGEGQQVL
jgi:hypothetical protein